MKKLLGILALWFSLGAASFAANVNIDGLPAAASVGGTDLLECEQGGTNRKCTAAQAAAYVYGLTSGDATVNGTGAVTFATVNANVGSFGSATQCVAHTVNGKGLITATSAVTCTPAIGSITGTGTGVITALGVNVGTAGAFVVNGGALGTPSSGVATNLTGTAAGLTAGTVTTNANLTGAVTSTGNATLLGSFSSANLLAALTTKTGTGNAVFGSAPTIDSLNATTAMTLAFITGSTQCLQVNTSGVISGTGSVCGGAGSTGANPTATAGPTAVNGVATTFMRSDGAPAVQQGSSSQKGIVQVDGTTITASSGVISAAPISAVPSVQTGTNYAILDGDRAKVIYLSNATAQTPTLPSAATLTSSNGWFVTICNINAGIQTVTPTTSTIGGAATLPIPAGSAARPVCWNAVSDGTNYSLVPAGNNNTIASGTSALGTSAIGSAACATAVTTSAAGTATTDVVLASFNGDPTAVTGYVPLTAGMLTIVGYPTANNVNFKVCNNTSSSITPGAITLNWRVVR
jgi:hypothetical protein